MASVTKVSLAIASGPTPTTKNVTASGSLLFDAADVGKSFRLEIKVFGEDKTGDKLPPTDGLGDNELYTFLWGVNVFNKKPYKVIAVAAAGPQPFTETRPVSVEKLDEDTGTFPPNNAPPGTPGPPLKDEGYARVTLSGAPTSARSATTDFSIGV